MSLVGLAAVGPGAALAGTLDQQQTDPGPGASLALNSSNCASQTFTAGISGAVDQVDLFLGTTSTPPTVPLSVEIRSVLGGTPGTVVLASQSVPASSVPASGAFVAVNFATPAPVAAGSQYAIAAYSGEPSNFYKWRLSSAANPYAGGASFYAATSPPCGSWTALLSMQDLAFKTYVVPAGPTTGLRAAALKKCKKKHKLLPV